MNKKINKYTFIRQNVCKDTYFFKKGFFLSEFSEKLQDFILFFKNFEVEPISGNCRFVGLILHVNLVELYYLHA